MAGALEAIRNAIGKRGPKLYETQKWTEQWPGMNLKEKLQALVMEKRTQDRELRLRRHLTWYLTVLYFRGFQSAYFNEDTSSFDVYDKQDFYVENQFRRHVETVKSMLNKLEGDIVVRPASDNPRDLAAARVADPILSMQRDAVGYDSVLDQKNLFKCLFGNTFIFTDYIRDKKYGSIVTPKYSYQEMPDPSFDPMDPMGELAGMPGMPPPEPPTILSKVVDGYTTRNKGSQVCTVCTPLEINTTADIHPFTSVPWIQWISRQDASLLNYLYPGLNDEGGMSSVEVDLATQYIDILANIPGNVLGDSLAFNRSNGARKKSELVRSWFQPCEFRGDKELEKQFPDGVHVATVNGRVVDYYEEDLFKCWTHEVLIPVPHSLYGDGLYDAILQQDQLNEANSLAIQHLRYSTIGRTYYNTNMLKSQDIINDPKHAFVPVALPMDQTVQQNLMQVGPNQLSGDVGAWIGQMRMAMQDMTGAYDPVSGKSMGANTPYSQSVFLSERAQSRWQGSFNYNRPEMIRFHRQLLESARDNWVDMQSKAVVDNTGKWSFEQFSQADLQGDVDILLSNTDVKPRTRAEQIQGLQMLTTLAPLIPALPPKQKLRIEEILGLPPDANPMSNQISRAYRMIDRLKKGEEITPLPLVDDPMAQIPTFADFLASEEGEALGEEQPEVFGAIYQYMILLNSFGIMEQSSPVGGMTTAMGGRQGAQPQQGAPGQPGEKNPAGGQPGQSGGANSKDGSQPNAQSPAQPAPPVAPPAPS